MAHLAQGTLGFLVIAATLSLAGCGKREQADAVPPSHQAIPLKPAPATPIDTKRVESGGKTWDPEWDKIVELALPPEMLSHEVPRDVRRFCPRFYEMAEADKRAFWAYFFQALAGAEAGLKPEAHVMHTDPEVAVKDGVTKRTARQEGLLQLRYEDEERYGCDFDWDRDKQLAPKDPEKTILQPKNNLECGVKILEKQIIEQHKALFSSTSYWATLRSGTLSYGVFAKQMTNVPLACGARNAKLVAKR